MAKKQHYMTWEERLKLEVLYNKARISVAKIAECLGFSRQTIYNELKVGAYVHTYDFYDRQQYSADKAQQIHELAQSGKGPSEKVADHHDFIIYIENLILNEHYSPAAALAKAKNDPDVTFEITISVRTLYHYIETGLFRDLTVDDLPNKGRRRKKQSEQKRRMPHPKLPSIADRPVVASDRSNPGHWEMDLVVGAKGTSPVLLTLVERRSRLARIVLLPNRQAATIRAAFDRMEQADEDFKDHFKTLTTDNGSEFMEYDKLVQSSRGEGRRFEVFYCHSFCAWEKGTNENTNRMIRRFFPKGIDFSKISAAEVARVEDWLNNYPRKILDWKTPEQVYAEGVKVSA